MFLLILSIFSLIFPQEAFAAAPKNVVNPVLPPNLTDLSGPDFFSALLKAIISAVFLIGAIIFFFTFIMGAIKWITANGDKGALESARGQISNALIGLVILFSVFAVVAAIQIFFKVNLLLLNLEALKVS